MQIRKYARNLTRNWATKTPRNQARKYAREGGSTENSGKVLLRKDPKKSSQEPGQKSSKELC